MRVLVKYSCCTHSVVAASAMRSAVKSGRWEAGPLQLRATNASSSCSDTPAPPQPSSPPGLADLQFHTEHTIYTTAPPGAVR